MSVSGSESQEDSGQFLVRVRAQVMTRDDSSGGWVPLGGGGLSNVSVRKRIPEKNEYLIQGKMISDQSIVLSCTIKRDFEYNKVMPTFHHWKTGNKKFGLTFQTAADARAFKRALDQVVKNLPIDVGISESSPLHKYTLDSGGDDDVFMALELPVERDSSSSASSRASVTCSQQYPPHSHLHRMYFSSKSTNGVRDGSGGGEGGCSSNYAPDKQLETRDKLYSEKDINREETYSSYVQFQRGTHDYHYPIVSDPLSKCTMSNCTSSVTSQPKMPLTLDPLNLPAPPLLPTKTTGTNVKKQRICGKRRRCRDCNEVYSEDSNPRASCETGPDPVRKGIDAISCMGCARGMLYHCVSGSEGDVPPHPCALRHHRCKRRWLALGLLSLILPCLCLYPPLIGCHYAARKCGLCGARHHPS